jgi:hypothetical protein
LTVSYKVTWNRIASHFIRNDGILPQRVATRKTST